MIQLVLPGAWNSPVTTTARGGPGAVYHMNTRQAELHAARTLGKDWKAKGYRAEDRP